MRQPTITYQKRFHVRFIDHRPFSDTVPTAVVILCSMLDWEDSSSGHYTSIHLEGARQTMNNLKQDSRDPSQDLNQAPPKYDSEALLLEPTCLFRLMTI
jgi:hypothetical protein